MKYKLQNLLKNTEVRGYVNKLDQSTLLSHDYHLFNFIDELGSANSYKQVHFLSTAICQQYGFDYFSFFVRFPRLHKCPISFVMRSEDNDWAIHYQKEGYILLTQPPA